MSRRAKMATFWPGTTRMKAFGSQEWLMKAVASPPTAPSTAVFSSMRTILMATSCCRRSRASIFRLPLTSSPA
jgi:hypothetical protein